MAGLTTQMDDLDDETARLIVELQLDDIKTQATDGELSEDAEYARRLQEEELQNYRVIRGFPEEPEPAVQPPQTLQTTSMSMTCSSCTDDYPSTDIYTPACGIHNYCRNCLGRMFNQAMTEDRFNPPRCCREEIPFENARHLLPVGLANNFEAKKPELDDKRRLYCHVQACSTYVPAANRTNEKGRCPDCGSETCVICGSESHSGDCPEDEGVKEVLQLAEKEGWKRCPQCQRMVELRTGCNHMTCICRAQFCMICGSHPWEVPDPVRPGSMKRSCDCNQFNENRLLERGQEIVERNGVGNAQEMAELLRRNHACRDHDWTRVNGAHNCEDCGWFAPTFIFRCRTCHVQMCFRCSVNA